MNTEELPERYVVDPSALTTSRQISAARWAVERERRREMDLRLAEFDEGYYRPSLLAIQEACGKIGHTLSFSNLGPLGDPWFFCVSCSKTEVRPSAGGHP